MRRQCLKSRHKGVIEDNTHWAGTKHLAERASRSCTLQQGWNLPSIFSKRPCWDSDCKIFEVGSTWWRFPHVQVPNHRDGRGCKRNWSWRGTHSLHLQESLIVARAVHESDARALHQREVEWRDNRRLRGFWPSSTCTSKQQLAFGSKHCPHFVEIRFFQHRETGSGLRFCCKLIAPGNWWRSCCECWRICVGEGVKDRALKNRQNLRESLERKAELPVRGEKVSSEKMTRSWSRNGDQKLGKEQSDLNDYSYNRRINGLIRLKERR